MISTDRQRLLEPPVRKILLRISVAKIMKDVALLKIVTIRRCARCEIQELNKPNWSLTALLYVIEQGQASSHG